MRHLADGHSRMLPVSSVIALLLALAATPALAQMLVGVNDETCVRGDCENGRGTLEFRNEYGKGSYVGEFLEGEFHGYGRLEIPVSFTAKNIYDGNWRQGLRHGRGTHWNGKGNLYIGEWENDKRHGRGTYAFNLPRWEENRYSEFWLRDNTQNYSGEWANDHYHGQGTFRWENGQRYEGGFFASEKHGFGTFYYTTGTARQQYWNYGDFVR